MFCDLTFNLIFYKLFLNNADIELANPLKQSGQNLA
jgi:hypothetical protein